MRVTTAALLIVLAQSQAQPPRFRTGVEVVEIDVSVLDRDRRPVRGLTAADFTILEDGQPQEIVAFNEIDLPRPDPTAAPWMREIAPDVRSNAPAGGRLLVLVLDDATLPANPATVATAKKIAREIVDGLGPQDLTAVLYTLNNRNSQDFTSDRGRLTRAIDRLAPGFIRMPMRSGAPVGSGVMQQPPFPSAPRAQLDDGLWYHYSIGTVKRAAEYLRDAPQRRKTLVYVSVGIPVEFTPAAAEAGTPMAESDLQRDLAAETQRAFVQAVQSNVSIYGIDPAGLQVENTRLNREFLQAISENTGGFAIVNTNAPEARVASVLEESGSYYLLGFQSTNQKTDRKLRRLDVRVSRPGVTVRARRGYYARRQDGSGARDAAARPALDSAIGGLLPKGDLPMHVAVAPFAVPGKREAALAIATRLEQPAVSERAQHKVDLLTALFDTDGRAKGAMTQSVDLTLRPGEATSQYEVLSRIDVKPGRYLLRIGAHGKDLDKAGSVYYDVDVPDFSKAALSMSGVVVRVTPAFKGGGGDALASLIPIVPTTRREFGRDDSVTAFVRVYQGGRKSPAPVSIAVRVLDSTNREVFGRSDTLPAASFAAERAADYTLELPLSGFAPATHVLTIEATAGRAAVRRDVRFSIR